MKSRMKCSLFASGLAVLGACATLTACGEDPAQETMIEVGYDDVSSRILVTLHPGLASGAELHVRVRQGNVGELDCAKAAGEIGRIDDKPLLSPTGDRFAGPDFDPNAFKSVYTTQWFSVDEPTAEMLEEARNSHHTIDICLMNGGSVVRELELDVRRALDRAGTNGKFDDTSRIASTVAYGEACVAELGEIPFFPKLADGDYGTYDCLDSTPIPTTVTALDGTVTYPETQVSTCDNPQFIYSLCEANAVTGRVNGPRVTSASNEQGTHWTLLCRKAQGTEGVYNDIAMVGTNPFTGKTCFFQNALYSRTDGRHVPHPADKTETATSPQQSASLWEGIHGGLGSGIACASCHDADPLIHTPWIDGALRQDGDPVIPKMGLHDDFQLGFNKAPYTILNSAAQGWTMPKVLVSEEAAACTKCHRIGDGRWADSWLARLEGSDSSWTSMLTESHKKFEHVYWMPPDLQSVTEANWAESEFGKALDFIQMCASNDSNPACKWEALPTEQVLDAGELPEVTLTGLDLAKEAVKVIGGQTADVADPRCVGPAGSCATRRCAECHSVSKNGLKHWEGLTRDANQTCNLNQNPEEMDPVFAKAAIDCLRAHPEDPTSVFAADKLGVLATGAQYNYFRKLFRAAYGDAGWLTEYLRFKARVSMPKGSHPALTQVEYATLKKWFEDGLPNIGDVVSDPPPPATCDEYLDTGAMAKHLNDMRFDGWHAVNEENGIRMFGCETGVCFPNAVDHAAEWSKDGSHSLLEVTQLGFRTSFWTRSSADGRFVANGGGTAGGATVTDLVRNVDIKIQASYDPGFFPDNSGFIFQGGGTGICTQSILDTATTINFNEPGCIRGNGINLYQHVARGINGGDYFIINSQFTSDSGGSNADPAAYFNADSTMKFSPMIFNGSVYEQLPAVIVESPFEGDSVLSPSGTLVLSRQSGPEGKSLGYVIRLVQAAKSDKNYKITTDQTIARACFSGAKPNVSFDERFFVTHHYENDVSNIYLVDMLDGSRHQITNMPAGKKALFPHFRSDGYFYFLVRGGDKETIVASDAAIRMSIDKPLP